MNDERFAKYTHKIKSMLPYWFKMKKQPHNSMGLQFLNVMGLQLDDIENILNYAYEQTNINTSDVDYIDIVYKALIPIQYSVKDITNVKVQSTIIIETESLYDFFGLDVSYGINNTIKNPDYYFFDRDKKVIYVREPYDKDNTFVNGRIFIDYSNGETISIPLTIHHVWNFYDEFGALFGCKRLYGERNADYKYRLLDVFKNPGGNSKFTLANAVSRELGLRKHKTWENPNKEFILEDKMVIVNSISVNEKPIDISFINLNSNGEIVISPLEVESNSEVSYICGIELLSLTGSKSFKFSNELYLADGTPTDLLLDYINSIKSHSSILWNDFNYDETMWVRNSDEFHIDHYSFIPSRLDVSIKGFSKLGYFKYKK